MHDSGEKSTLAAPLILEGVSVQAEQWRCVTDKMITIEQAYAVTTIQV